MSSDLQLDEISVAYGAAKPVVDDLSLVLPAGQIACLLGPSGCGKTTVLRAIAGFEPLQRGSIRLGEVLLSSATLHRPPEQRQVGMMFQEYALFPHLSARHNVGFGLRRQARPQREVRVAQLLDLVGLADAGERYPHELSGGQQQRIALARALAPSPSLLLLDEPFSNLDEANRERLLVELRTILRDAGQTALLVTHNTVEAQALADWVGRMQEGRLASWSAAGASLRT